MKLQRAARFVQPFPARFCHSCSVARSFVVQGTLLLLKGQEARMQYGNVSNHTRASESQQLVL